MKPEWFPDWSGETCVVVASGPSAQSVPITKAKGAARFIAVNRSIELCPWADVWYGCDYAFWKHVLGGPLFTGMKMSIDVRACREWPDIHNLECRKVTDIAEFTPSGKIGWGGNSGFHALQIAVQTGCKKVLLVGLDATVKHGNHWHSDYPDGMANPRASTVVRWKKAIDAPARKLANMGVTVINCSSISELRGYPKMTFTEALAA